MSRMIFPFETKNKRKGKFLFCFNPYPASALNPNIAVDGYLTSDHIEDLCKGWGIRILKICTQDARRNIIEDGDKWPFFGDHRDRNPFEMGQSLFDVLLEKRLLPSKYLKSK